MSFLAKTSLHKDFIQIDGQSYNVIKTFQKCESMIVGIIDLGGEEGRCVVKYAINQNKPAMFTIRNEALFYKILQNSPVKTLKLSSKFNSNQLVFQDVAKGDLRSWCYDILYGNQTDGLPFEDQFSTIVDCFLQTFDQIKALHSFGYTHCDIRPANILILEDDTPCLIDLVTANEIGTTLYLIPGTLFYMAEDLLHGDKDKFFKYKCKYDMESLFYSFLDCADRHYSSSFLRSCIEIDSNHIVPNFNERTFAAARKNRLNELRASNDPSHFQNSKFVELFSNYLIN